jgi:nucleotide-binding universal stress UspA family protein
MMIAVKRILVPTDFSEASDAALNYGIGLAQKFSAQLYLLHVPGETGENSKRTFPSDDSRRPRRSGLPPS